SDWRMLTPGTQTGNPHCPRPIRWSGESRRLKATVSEDDVGRVLKAKGERQLAEERFRAALATAEHLAAIQPRNTRVQTDLTVIAGGDREHNRAAPSSVRARRPCFIKAPMPLQLTRHPAHSMRDSAQVTSPGAINSMIAAMSTRPNRQNRSTCGKVAR